MPAKKKPRRSTKAGAKARGARAGRKVYSDRKVADLPWRGSPAQMRQLGMALGMNHTQLRNMRSAMGEGFFSDLWKGFKKGVGAVVSPVVQPIIEQFKADPLGASARFAGRVAPKSRITRGLQRGVNLRRNIRGFGMSGGADTSIMPPQGVNVVRF